MLAVVGSSDEPCHAMQYSLSPLVSCVRVWAAMHVPGWTPSAWGTIHLTVTCPRYHA